MRRAASVLITFVFAFASRSARAESESTSAPVESGATEAQARAAKSDGVDSVRVRGARTAIGGLTIRPEEVRSIPGSLGDPFRFVEVVPGVVPSASGLQTFFIRGAPPTATGFFLDGVRVPALFHIGFGPSLVPPSLIDRVDFHPGAAPARYGRYVGGVLAGQTTLPSPELHGEATLRSFDAGALVEAPFDDARGAALAAGRYSYPGAILSLIAPGIGLSFWDYQARVSYKPSSRERLTLWVFGSGDDLTTNTTASNGQTFAQQLVSTHFHRLDLRYDHELGQGALLDVAATVGIDQVGDETTNTSDRIVNLRARVEAPLSRSLRIDAGADVILDALSPDAPPRQPDGDETTLPRVRAEDDLAAGADVELTWRLSRAVELVPGARADLLEAARAISPLAARLGAAPLATPTIDPRFAARVTFTPGLTWISTIGSAHQLPGLTVPPPQVAPDLSLYGRTEAIQTAAQLSEGINTALPWELTASATGFLQRYEGLPDITGPCYLDMKGAPCLLLPVRGLAYGLELLVRRPLTDWLSVLVSYTLSRSTREAHRVTSYPAEDTVASDYDRTHVVSALASIDLGKRWRVGGRFYFYSGRPYVHTYRDVPIAPYNSDRLPPFGRLDLRVEKAWSLGRARLTLVLEGVNVTGAKEVVDARCGIARGGRNAAWPGTTRLGFAGTAMSDPCLFDELGPITIPNIGLEASF